ncbi:MAG: acyl carrier protein [Terriglobales bacterium]
MAKPEPEQFPLAAALGRYILTELAPSARRTLDPDTALFESLLDSTSVLALVSHVEQQYQLTIQDSEVVPANFSTLRRLADFIQRKQQRALAPLAANG